MPTIVNLRQDPFERTPSIRGQSLNDLGGGYMNDFYAREFWRFVLVQQTGGGPRHDRHRLPADAGSRLLQPGRDQEEDRRDDQEPRRAVGSRQSGGRGRMTCPPSYVLSPIRKPMA